MRKSLFLILASLATMLLTVNVGGTETSPSYRDDLGSFVGTWRNEYVDSDGDNLEIWSFQWNSKETFLEFCTETSINGEVQFLGSGAFLADAGDSRFRLYLMMDNGVMHESVGSKNGDGFFAFESTSFGIHGFPAHKVELTRSEETLIVSYIYPDENGGTERSEQVFVRD